ncbi:MAG TPA: hypothetical protein VKI17_07495, partial [Gemmataceae bacterium]|nr:hypothetical protein [Gemmataceae bacterium]
EFVEPKGTILTNDPGPTSQALQRLADLAGIRRRFKPLALRVVSGLTDATRLISSPFAGL